MNNDDWNTCSFCGKKGNPLVCECKENQKFNSDLAEKININVCRAINNGGIGTEYLDEIFKEYMNPSKTILYETKILFRIDRNEEAYLFTEIYLISKYYSDGSVEKIEEMGPVHFYHPISIY